jgi:hypothetical protein
MGKVPPVKGYRITAHARFAPEQAEVVRPGRVVYQSRFERGEPSRMCLLRVFVDVDREPAEVVTAYWSSKVEKYWRSEG